VRKAEQLLSPVDDTVTYRDYQDIIKPIIAGNNNRLRLESLFQADFNKQSLLRTAGSSRFLELYCHGVGLNTEDLGEKPGYQGAFVIQFDSNDDSGLLTPQEVIGEPFVPGGIVFSPACLSGGTQADSDFASWVERDTLPAYLGNETKMGAISDTLLSSPTGPIAALLHFDVSMSASMYNPATREYDLQRMLHAGFVERLIKGQTLGRSTKPFRSAAGTYYAQAIYVFGQIAGTNPIMGRGKEPGIGQFVDSMNQYHVIATDMRNYIIIGDPAVRLAG
jgi:hypothetical protein